MSTLKRRIIRAGGWGLAKRLIKPIPIIGTFFALGLAAFEIKKKGLLPGAVHVGLDVTPVVGTAKNVLEIFTGDLIPDKADRQKKLEARRLQQLLPQEPVLVSNRTTSDEQLVDTSQDQLPSKKQLPR